MEREKGFKQSDLNPRFLIVSDKCLVGSSTHEHDIDCLPFSATTYLELCHPKEGETLVVNGAAGAGGLPLDRLPRSEDVGL